MKFLKYALAAAGVLALMAAAFAAYIVLTFDVRDHEPRIIALVKEKTSRTLVIRGQTRLAFWPDLAVTIGPVTLSERDSDVVFAEVQSARLVAKLKPLLHKVLVADELHFEGATVRIVRDGEGRLNIDDLLRGEGGALDFDIAKARISRSSLVYEDVATGARHEFSELDAVTGRLASGVPTSVALSFKARDAAGAYAVSSSVQGRLAFDLEQQAYRVHDAAVQVEGKLGGIRDVAAKIGISVLDLSKGEAGADSLVIEARSAEWHIGVKAPRVEVRDGAVRAAEATFEFDGVRDGWRVSATIAAGVSAAVAARTVELAQVRANFAAKGAALPARGVAGALAGTASIDARTGRAQADFSGTVLDSRVKARVDATGSAPPAYTFLIDVDALDLDRLGASSGAAKAGEPFDVATLSELGAEGIVRIGSLTSSGVVAKNVRFAVRR